MASAGSKSGQETLARERRGTRADLHRGCLWRTGEPAGPGKDTGERAAGAGEGRKAGSWMQETFPGMQLSEVLSAAGRSRKTHVVKGCVSVTC